MSQYTIRAKWATKEPTEVFEVEVLTKDAKEATLAVKYIKELQSILNRCERVEKVK